MSEISSSNLLEQLQWRYATKAFDPNQIISDEHIEAIEQSLVLTPSSFGLQPWHFLVISSQEIRQQLLPNSWNQRQVVDCSHFVVLAAKTSMTEADIDRFLERQIAVRGGSMQELSAYRDMMLGFTSSMDAGKLLQWAKLQTYIALGQLMTSAALLGIDGCPMEGIDPVAYDKILDLPSKGLTTSVACALGYRSKEDAYAAAAKVRFEKSELITTQ